MFGFDIFLSEFLDYVLSLSIERDNPVNFGNMDFDYSVLFDGVDYWLEIYPVALDHYGMPYRNCLEVERHIVSSYFGVQKSGIFDSTYTPNSPSTKSEKVALYST